MYILGTQYDFASRLHQLATMNIPTGVNPNGTSGTLIGSGLASINSFLTEGRSYINSGTVTAQESGKWEQEIRKQRWLLSGDASQMLTQQF